MGSKFEKIVLRAQSVSTTARMAHHLRLPLSTVGQAALRWVAVILWMGLIFALSSNPSIDTPFEAAYDFTFKKFAHVVVYGILTALLFSALRIHIRNRRHALLIAVLIAVVYGISDEWHQTFVPGREGTLRDVAIDTVGAVVMSMWLRIRP